VIFYIQIKSSLYPYLRFELRLDGCGIFDILLSKEDRNTLLSYRGPPSVYSFNVSLFSAYRSQLTTLFVHVLFCLLQREDASRRNEKEIVRTLLKIVGCRTMQSDESIQPKLPITTTYYDT
jgi:hypothetical protein